MRISIETSANAAYRSMDALLQEHGLRTNYFPERGVFSISNTESISFERIKELPETRSYGAFNSEVLNFRNENRNILVALRILACESEEEPELRELRALVARVIVSRSPTTLLHDGAA